MAQDREQHPAGLPRKRRCPREDRMRRWIGGQLKQLGCQLPDPVWSSLLRSELLTDHLESDESLTTFLQGGDSENAREDVLSDARAYFRRYREETRSKPTRGRRRAGARLVPKAEVEGRVDLSRHLAPDELRRAELLTAELGRLAEKFGTKAHRPWAEEGKPLVGQFRDYYLEGRRLTQTQADDLLNSIGAAIFEFDFFRAKGIPLVGHRSSVIRPAKAVDDWSRPGLNAETEIEFMWKGHSLAVEIGTRANHVDMSVDELGPLLRGKMRILLPGRISFLARLMDLAGMLSFRFPWSLRDSARFVLTGKVPYASPIAIGFADYNAGPSHALSRVVLTVQPWLSADAVLRVYRRIQRVLIGPRNRPPRTKGLELFAFVSERRHRGATFPEVLGAWLATHPSERKRYPKRDATSVARFTSSYRDVERQVMRPFGRADAKEAKQ